MLAYFQRHALALQITAQNGRDGLGTVVVFAAGNERATGFSSNYNNLQNSRLTIAVAALNDTGVYAYYSSPGANLLVSAFGGESSIGAADGIVTTDRLGPPGYNLSNDDSSGTDYTDQFGGTSAATPMVVGIVALMLEANPALGYRDVQTILAYSARQNDPDMTRWQTNGATNWNGGGLHTSLDYGFGLVDAQAAVRLAETWTDQQTYDNEQVISAQSDRLQRIPDLGEAIDAIAIEQTLNLTHAEVSLSLFHTFPVDLQIVLISPKGTQSVLANQPQPGSQTLKFTFSSTQYWGETSSGNWTLKIRDRVGLDAGMLYSWTLRLYGGAPTADNTYIYTNEFAQVATDAARQTLQDLSGNDTINAAAITATSVLNLAPGTLSSLAGQPLAIQPDSVIENAFTGDGDDTLSGNSSANLLKSGRGQDWVSGLGGRDFITGGKGEDTLYGNGGQDGLLGNCGNDQLSGGGGNDQLTGGAGRDRFLYSYGAMVTPTTFGVDLITDFAIAMDKLVLSKTAFAALRSSVGSGFSVNTEFASVANDQSVASSRGLIVYSRATGGLFYNANGTADGLGTGTQFAMLADSPMLTARDFTLST